MPLKYEGIIKEHIHTRKYASVFDTCHMGVLNLKGSTAINDVTMLVAGHINCLESGKCTYGFPERLIGFRLEERQSSRNGDTIFAGSEKIGSVTSGCFAPSLGYAVGMGYINVGYSTPDTEFEIQVRKKRLKAWCVTLPFYSHGTVSPDNS